MSFSWLTFVRNAGPRLLSEYINRHKDCQAFHNLRRWLHTDLAESTDDRSSGWDGLSILSFDSREDLEAALASEEWRAAVAHVGEMRGRRMIFTGDEFAWVTEQQDA